MKPLEIIQFSSEVSPYSKSGGLADVVRSLPRALKRMGHKVSVITPFYKFIQKSEFPIKKLDLEIEIPWGKQRFKFTYFKTISQDKYPVFFVFEKSLFGKNNKIYCYPYFKNGLRFLLFNLASLEMIKAFHWQADVFHCHDWQTGLIPNFLKTRYKDDLLLSRVPTLFTIHNLVFQGPIDWWKIPQEKRDKGKGDIPEDLEKIKWLNFSKRAILYADLINTVSERYAQEIITPEYGCGLDKDLKKRKNRLYGIINGIDYHIFNPKFDKHIYINYDYHNLKDKVKNKVLLQKEFGLEVNQHLPLIGMANRLTEQKGFELIVQILDQLLKLPLQIAVVGKGEKSSTGKQPYVDVFLKAKKKYPKKLLFVTPFYEHLARKIYAASDLYLLPSRFEPCGMSQLISLRYGSIPIVHKVGGLTETIKDYNPRNEKGNGFVFSSYTPSDLLMAITRALENYRHQEKWKNLVIRAMKESYSWTLSAEKYVDLYEKAISLKKRTLKKGTVPQN